MKIYESAEALVGETPLLHLKKLEREAGLKAHLYAKLEMKNPAASAKDRVALYMLRDFEARGLINENTVIVEPTSGNTGIGLAALCAARGVKLVIVMPGNMSRERIQLIAAYGAELVLTDAALGMAGAIGKAEEICRTTPGALLAGQFTNPQNPRAHYETTGPELWRDTDGMLDGLVAGVGTGGTLTGTGRYLKEQKPSVSVIAVEPADSPLLSGGKAGPHGLQGIGANFIPEILDRTVYDEVIGVTTGQAYEAARTLAKTEGILAGISSGAALSAAIRVCRREENAGRHFAVILVDAGDRYLSTDLYEV